jgi:flagellar basal-body rod modification protein FlgD
MLPINSTYLDQMQSVGNPKAFAPENQMGQKEFLMLLTTQMMNQDPTKPMDPTSFVTDLTQMSQLEATTQLNQSVMSMTAGFQNLQVMQASSLIGKNVVAKGEVFSHQQGSPSSLRLNSTEALNDVKLVITDSRGVVKEISKPGVSSGETVISWDGKNAEGGDAASGDYKLVAYGYDEDGEIKAIDTLVGTSVASVSIGSDGSMTLTLSTGERVRMDAVREIS